MAKQSLASICTGAMLLIPMAIATASTAQAAAPTYTPGNNPCSNPQNTTVANAIASAMNTALTGLPAQKSVTKSSSASFTVPKWGNWFGYGYIKGGGNTYSASASSTKTATGINTGVATVQSQQDTCSYTTGSYTSSGQIQSAITWQPINVTIDASVKGFFATYYNGTPVKVTISGLTVSLPGKYTFTSSSATSAALSQLSFAECSVNSQVTATVLGVNNSNVAQSIQQKINGEGPTICSQLNSQVSTMIPYTVTISN